MPVCRTGAPTHALIFILSFFRRTRAPKACGIPCQRPGYRRTPAPCRTVQCSLPSTTENLLNTIHVFSFSLFLTLGSSFTVSRAAMLLFYSFPLLFFTPLGAPISSSPFGSLFVFTCSFHLSPMPTAYFIHKCSLALDFIFLSLFLPFFLLSIVILTNMLRFPCFF